MSVPILVGILGWAAAGTLALALTTAGVILAWRGLRFLWQQVLWPYGLMRHPWAQQRLIRRTWEKRMRRRWAWALLENQGGTLKHLHPILYRWLIDYLARTRTEARAQLVPYRLPSDFTFPIQQREAAPHPEANAS